ncbi:hypothetical protein ILUMI_01630 [Ignelater luminosus]|uniref:TIL domain-containing protein n=1 Tax=Ignelater luminosus TaxID=2038154 RepID=A0A8K0DHY3_IGNLU|nr:hypothetical protein ILUMI_01630 [Ignelater luminosus]
MKFLLWCSSLALVIICIQGQAGSTPPSGCKGPNEKYECGSGCQNKCGTVGEACPHTTSISKHCYRECYCLNGYARDSSGTCIPEENCSLQKHF